MLTAVVSSLFIVISGGYASGEKAGWTNMSPVEEPSPRYVHDMAYDNESDRIILFGGWTGSVVNDTWAYDFNTNAWTNMSPDTRPSARDGHAMDQSLGIKPSAFNTYGESTYPLTAPNKRVVEAFLNRTRSLNFLVLMASVR